MVDMEGQHFPSSFALSASFRRTNFANGSPISASQAADEKWTLMSLKRGRPGTRKKDPKPRWFRQAGAQGDFMGVVFIPAFSEERRELSRRANPTRQNIDVTIFSLLSLNR